MDILMKKYSLDSKLAEAYDDKNFKPEEDAEKLRYAMKGSIIYIENYTAYILNVCDLGFIMINQKLIVDIITKRTNKQLQEIKLFYWYIFNRRLINDLQDALSENVNILIFLKFYGEKKNLFYFKDKRNNFGINGYTS
jgi:hypothetical protein